MGDIYQEDKAPESRLHDRQLVVAAGTPCRLLRAITDADRHVWPDERG